MSTSIHRYFFLIASLTVIMLPFILNQDLQVNAEVEKYRQRNLLGGYTRVENTKSAEIDTLSQLVYQKLQEGQGPIVSFASSMKKEAVAVVAIEVSQQVVAGVNFRMKLGFFQNNEGSSKSSMKYGEMAGKENCLGGISVIVFRNLAGEYSVERWGRELSCDEVLKLLNKNEGDE